MAVHRWDDIFALDGVIFLLASDWLGVAFHAFVLYCLFRGFRACRAVRPESRNWVRRLSLFLFLIMIKCHF